MATRSSRLTRPTPVMQPALSFLRTDFVFAAHFSEDGSSRRADGTTAKRTTAALAATLPASAPPPVCRTTHKWTWKAQTTAAAIARLGRMNHSKRPLCTDFNMPGIRSSGKAARQSSSGQRAHSPPNKAPSAATTAIATERARSARRRYSTARTATGFMAIPPASHLRHCRRSKAFAGRNRAERRTRQPLRPPPQSLSCSSSSSCFSQM